MNNLNSILLEGNLTNDPVYNLSPKGTPICTFSIASNRYYKKDEETVKDVDFFDIETWSKLADNCNNYLTKGRGVRVIGRLKQDRWINNNGDNRYKIKIVAEHVEFKPLFVKKPA